MIISQKTKKITIKALKQFGDKVAARTLQKLHLLAEDDQREFLQALQPVIWYGDFTDDLPMSPFVYEFKVVARERGWAMQSASKVYGSYWDAPTASRQPIKTAVTRLTDNASGAALDFEHPSQDDWIRFHRFELPVRSQGKGLGCGVFVSFFNELMAATSHAGMESTILSMPEAQPMFWDSRRNWRFEMQDGHTKLFNWWRRLGGEVLDPDDPERMYFRRGKLNCISEADTLAA
jgi:hypothetical protein